MVIQPVPADAILLEIIGHLHAAHIQGIPSDDQIIAAHISSALDLAKMLHKASYQHIHVAMGDGSDTCKACGHDLRSDIHVRIAK